MSEQNWMAIELKNVVVVKPHGELDMNNSFQFKSFVKDTYINAGDRKSVV